MKRPINRALGNSQKYIFQDLYTSDMESYLSRINHMIQRPVPLLIMGEVKSGKTSFINALLGRNLLATGAVPTTAVVTHIRYGDKRFLYEFKNGSVSEVPFQQLHDVTSEQGLFLQQHRDELRRVIIYYPHPLLKVFEIIDSPGLNSLHASHTESTVDGIDQAAHIFYLFRYGAVGRQTEMDHLKALEKKGHRPFGVVTKIDRHDERSGHSLSSYLEREYDQLKPYLQDLVGVSSFDYFDYLENGDEEAYVDSQFTLIFQQLESWANTYAFTKEEEDKIGMLFRKMVDTLDRVSLAQAEKEVKPLAEEKEKLQRSITQANHDLIRDEQTYQNYVASLKRADTEQAFILRYEEEIGTFPQEIRDSYARWQEMNQALIWHEEWLGRVAGWEEEIEGVYQTIHELNTQSTFVSYVKSLWERRRFQPIVQAYEEGMDSYANHSYEYPLLYDAFFQQSEIVHWQMNYLWNHFLNEKKRMYQQRKNDRNVERMNAIDQEGHLIMERHQKKRRWMYEWIREWKKEIEKKSSYERTKSSLREELPHLTPLPDEFLEPIAFEHQPKLPNQPLETWDRWLHQVRHSTPFYSLKHDQYHRYQEDRKQWQINLVKKISFGTVVLVIAVILLLFLRDWWV